MIKLMIVGNNLKISIVHAEVERNGIELSEYLDKIELLISMQLVIRKDREVGIDLEDVDDLRLLVEMGDILIVHD